ncbi:hypothetical protein INR49_010002 [Caranx melampygus]|nr:hypothetical protein INR49_010002 [Caranx melampygus]
MLSPRRWTREPPLSSVTSCVRRGLCSRRHFLWTLLVLLLVCIAFQTFVTRSARTDKLTGPRPGPGPGLPHVVWELRQKTRPVQTSPDPLKGAQQKSSDNVVLDKTLNHVMDSDLEGQLDPDPLVLHSTRTPLTAGPEQRLVHSPSASKIHPTTSCHPKSHIVFLKTHKTASSTILNILYRYGESRNLTFALPVNKRSQLFYPLFFTSHFVEGVSSRTVMDFNIMCNHMRFRKSEVAKVMPENTFYFSILRHPVPMMESIFIYYKAIPAFHKTRSLDDFLDNSWRNYNTSATNNHYAHNILAFDFGLDNNVAADAADLEARVSRAVATIEQEFHIILISEYFDESMVLLRHALCWSLEDVVSFKLNSRSEETRHELSADTPEKIRRWNALDWKIYLHFNATFWHKVDQLVGPEQMKREVSRLRELQVKLANTCLKDGRAVNPSQIKDAGLKPFQYGAAVIQGYNLNPDLDPETRTRCQRLITPELQYTEHLYTQQFPELAAKLKRTIRNVPLQRQRPGRTAMMGTHRSDLVPSGRMNMEHRTNSRGVDEYFVKRRHLNLLELKEAAADFNRNNPVHPIRPYIFTELVPAFPRAELHVSHLKHDTDQVGLRGIQRDRGFGAPGLQGPERLQWWSLAVKAEDVVSAERRLLDETFPLRTEEQARGQCGVLGKFASSPVFQETSRLGSYRFTFPLEEVLQAYSQQFCCGAPPVMRVFKTVLYKQEVMYVVLVHSPANQKFEDYPLLRDDPNAICVYRDGGFIWRCQAMCETHRYQLVQRPERNQVEAVELSGLDAKFYVWDHVAVALHLEDRQFPVCHESEPELPQSVNWSRQLIRLKPVSLSTAQFTAQIWTCLIHIGHQVLCCLDDLKTTWLPFLGLFEDTEVVKSKCLCLVLSFDDVRLRQSLTFCDRGDGSYHHSFDHLEDADVVVCEEVWPRYPTPLQKERSLQEALAVQRLSSRGSTWSTSRSSPPSTLIIGDSIVEGMRLRGGHTLSFPEDTVQDITVKLPDIMRSHPEVDIIVIHAGAHDVAKQESELLKRDFLQLFQTVRFHHNVFISGPITCGGGSEHFSRLLGLNTWLSTVCGAYGLRFIDNFNLFWKRWILFKADGLHLNNYGRCLLSDNISYVIQPPPPSVMSLR